MTTALVGVTVIDGTGQPAVRADVLISESRIATVGDLGQPGPDVARIDVTGRCVAPGLVDTHSHGDDAPLLADANRMKLRKGVTTEVVGNCGIGLAPPPLGAAVEALERFFQPIDWPGRSLADLLAETDRRGHQLNYVPLVPHGALRGAVAGMQAAPLTGEQAAAMGARIGVDYVFVNGNPVLTGNRISALRAGRRLVPGEHLQHHQASRNS